MVFLRVGGTFLSRGWIAVQVDLESCAGGLLRTHARRAAQSLARSRAAFGDAQD
jgi:hypothetical protein